MLKGGFTFQHLALGANPAGYPTAAHTAVRQIPRTVSSQPAITTCGRAIRLMNMVQNATPS